MMERISNSVNWETIGALLKEHYQLAKAMKEPMPTPL